MRMILAKVRKARLDTVLYAALGWRGPYSLGKSVEWKRFDGAITENDRAF